MQKSKLQFTEEDWSREMSRYKVCGLHPQIQAGSCNLPCPSCGVAGFYNPRGTPDESGNVPRKYRACKFCGFWQEAFGKLYDEKGGEPYRCIIVRCKDCVDKGFTAYDWQVPWAYEQWSCKKCGKLMEKTKWASDDSTHLFHKLKERIDKAHQAASFN